MSWGKNTHQKSVAEVQYCIYTAKKTFVINTLLEARLMVPDFIISLFGSSFNCIFFSLILVALLFFFLGIPRAEWKAKI